MILDEKLAAGHVIVLDGATGTEIARLGGEMNAAAWCGVANRTHPDTVRRVHESYLDAGADVIIQIIGGCCGTTIRHIRAMVDRLPERPGLRPDARVGTRPSQQGRTPAADTAPSIEQVVSPCT